jgi:hypothetical protein
VVVGWVALAVFAATAGPAVASAAARQWSLQATPSRQTNDALNGVSCVSSTRCVAVGGVYVPANSGRPLVELWNGRAWSLQRLPSPSGADSTLDGVSCSSRVTCTAVGVAGNHLLVMRWNGRKWAIQHAPGQPGATQSYLFGVSCSSMRDCFAVGNWSDSHGFYPLLEHWDGSQWSIRPTAEPFGSVHHVELFGVSCTSRAACTAVGVANSSTGPDAVVERWNGAQWSAQNPGLRSFYATTGAYTPLNGVSCASKRACAAVGQAYVDGPSGSGASGSAVWSLAEFWAGEKWGDLSTQGGFGSSGDNDLLGVSCASPAACLAVGTVVQRWDGNRWLSVSTPFALYPYGPGQFNAVSCSSGTSCEVVGWKANSQGVFAPLAVRWSW